MGGGVGAASPSGGHPKTHPVPRTPPNSGRTCPATSSSRNTVPRCSATSASASASTTRTTRCVWGRFGGVPQAVPELLATCPLPVCPPGVSDPKPPALGRQRPPAAALGRPDAGAEGAVERGRGRCARAAVPLPPGTGVPWGAGTSPSAAVSPVSPPQYVVQCHGQTLLPRFLGMYRVSVDSEDTYLLVMRNLFSHRLPVHRKYDLKVLGCPPSPP